MNKQSRISTNEVLQSSLINTAYYLLVNNNEGEGLINILPQKRGSLLERGGGGGGEGLIEDLRYFLEGG